MIDSISWIVAAAYSLASASCIACLYKDGFKDGPASCSSSCWSVSNALAAMAKKRIIRATDLWVLDHNRSLRRDFAIISGLPTNLVGIMTWNFGLVVDVPCVSE